MTTNNSQPIPTLTLPANFAANGLSLAEIVPLHDEPVVKTEPVVTFDHSNITIPHSFADVDVSNLEAICNHIESNLDQLPSNPVWSIQSDVGFEICQESIKWIYDNKDDKTSFPFYRYLPHVALKAMNSRLKYPCDILTLATIFKTHTEPNPMANFIGWKLGCGIEPYIYFKNLYETAVFYRSQCEKYAIIDSLTSTSDMVLFIKENDKKAKVLYNNSSDNSHKIDKRYKPKKDLSSLEEARIAWKEAVANRRQTVCELDLMIEEQQRAWKDAIRNKKEILIELDTEIASLKAIMQAESLKLK